MKLGSFFSRYIIALSIVLTFCTNNVSCSSLESESKKTFVLGFQLQDNQIVSSNISPMTQEMFDTIQELQNCSQNHDVLLIEIIVDSKDHTITMVPLVNPQNFTMQDNIIKYLINNDDNFMPSKNFEEGAHLKPMVIEAFKIIGDQLSFLLGVKLLILTQSVKLVRRISCLGAQALVFSAANLHNYVLDPGYNHLVIPTRNFAVDCLEAKFLAQE